MIEIMCRDGKVPSKELEKVADMIYYSTGIETEVVYEEDRRAWCSGALRMSKRSWKV